VPISKIKNTTSKSSSSRSKPYRGFSRREYQAAMKRCKERDLARRQLDEQNEKMMRDLTARSQRATLLGGKFGAPCGPRNLWAS
jgi:hypothetical protein